MKKIFLNLFLVVSVMAFTACGGDDDSTDTGTGSKTGSLIADIDGTTITFNTFTANTYVSSGEPATDITASIDSGVSKIIEFQAYGLGSAAIWSMNYKEGATIFYGQTLSANVTAHTANNLVGTFTGTFSDGTQTRTISGSFNYTF